MRPNFKIIYFTGVTLLLVACSTKKDAFANRNWHALNTKYNVLYNGKNALQDGREELIKTYTDNYWEVLPVERLNIREEIILEGTELNPNFERAEEKAVKAIQKHGMNINGREKNPQIDEAYLLLGKARYFDQRFVPAIEAFNYILYKYPQSDIVNQARIWREKTNIRMENEELALRNLKRLLEQEKVEGQDYADAMAIMGQAYINLEYKDSAVQKLKAAAYYTKSNEERGRYYYILGQLYNQLEYKDSAVLAFDKVIELNRRTPRVYLINAEVEKIRNLDAGTDPEALFEKLTDMEENRENRPFLDKIYREKALYFLKQDSIEGATAYFNKSLRTNTPDSILKGLNYENLAQLNFDASRYKTAGAYYDSTLVFINKNSKKFRQLTRKSENLADVIKYEDIVTRNDSILYVVSLSEEDRRAFYQKHLDSIKAAKIALQEKEELKALQKANKGATGLAGSANENKNFYFYNQTSVQYGINAFRQKWGQRELRDNWRLSVGASQANNEETASYDAKNSGSELTADFFLQQLPQSKTQIDSISNERNFANYQLGLIYMEKFREDRLAADKLQSVLDHNPEERLVLPSKYNLYKIYQRAGSPLAEQVKTDIVLNYPDSRYAEILQNPQVVLTEDENNPDVIYGRLYKDFEAQSYETVIVQADEYVEKYNGQDIAPKFEMLKASSIARLDGYLAYKDALNEIALNYPNNIEGKEAKNMVDTVLPKLENSTLSDEESARSWKLIFPFKKSDTLAIQKLFETLERSLKELNYTTFSISKDVYDREQTFVVVHGLSSKDRALGYAELLNINKDYLITKENFVISSPNYKVVQIHKNIRDYLARITNQLNN